MTQPEDELFHNHHNDVHWNESSWIPFHIPEKKLCGWIYYFHRTALGYSIGGVCAWDPSGEDVWNCRIHDWGTPYPTPEGAQMHDFSLPNGLTVKCLEPLQDYHFTFDGGGCQLNLRWQAVMPPHDSGFKKHSNEWGSSHFEQAGRITGSIILDGEALQVDCWSNRDRSWGPREVKVNPRGDFPWAIANKDNAFHITAMSDKAWSDDPIDNVIDPILAGWYMRDGKMGTIESGTREVIRSDDGRVLTTRIVGVDHLGRELRATGDSINWFRWTGIPVFNYWSLVKWGFDGFDAWGEVQDFYPLNQFRQFTRKRNKG